MKKSDVFGRFRKKKLPLNTNIDKNFVVNRRRSQ